MAADQSMQIKKNAEICAIITHEWKYYPVCSIVSALEKSNVLDMYYWFTAKDFRQRFSTKINSSVISWRHVKRIVISLYFLVSRGCQQQCATVGCDLDGAGICWGRKWIRLVKCPCWHTETGKGVNELIVGRDTKRVGKWPAAGDLQGPPRP